jgi:hypothetical protein
MSITKREFLKAAGVLTAGGLSAALQAQEAPVQKVEPAVLKNTAFSWVRGFNYQPGYASGTGGYEEGTGWSIWRDLKTDIIEKELTRGKELFPEMTAVRIWLPYNVYLAQPKKFLDDFSKFIGIIGKLKLRTMVVLFNAWHGTPDFGGFREGTFGQLTAEQLAETYKFADALLDRHGNDETIYAWDLCNEPDLRVSLYYYYTWLETLYKRIKDRNEKTVITIGTCKGRSALEKYTPINDLFSIHPYYVTANKGITPQKHHLSVNGLVDYANSQNKPMVISETGWGSLQDEERVKTLHIDLSTANARKLGWLIHALQHSYVADLHRPEYGPVNGPGYMGCIEPNGSMRPGHEIINDYLKQ